MKISRVAALASALATLTLFPGSARAISGSDVIHYYYSDPQMTNVIGWTEAQCYTTSVIRHGIYAGGPGWATYTATNRVYERFDQQRCDNGNLISECWIWWSSTDYSLFICTP